MTATLACHVTFIQSPFWTKTVESDSNSNLVSVEKIRLNSRCDEDLVCILVQGSLILDCICNVKYRAMIIVARPFLDRRNFFHDFFWTSVFFK